MKTITLALPFDETAAVVADVLSRRDTPLTPMPVDLIALGLARWAELEITQLISQAPAILTPSNAAGRRLIAALAAAARLEEHDPPLHDVRRRRKAARQLASRFGLRVQEWMMWELWHSQIGCNVCQVVGPKARCWGAYGCHGYANGCGCADCTAHYRIMDFRRRTEAETDSTQVTGGDQ